MSAPEWTFDSVITSPAGVRTAVTITVPMGHVWRDVHEAAEIAQMCAGRAQQMITQSEARPPF